MWVNRAADFVGGAEHYVARTVRLLKEQGVRSSLLYEVDGWMEPRFTSLFDGAFPWVDPARQVAQIGPDVIYVHQLRDEGSVREFTKSGVPVVRFFHDHKLFCPREHKYTTLGHQTCTQVVSASACWPCLGTINRAQSWPGLRLRTVTEVRGEIAANSDLSGYVVGSTYMKNHVVAHGLSAARVRVLSPFVDPPRGVAEVARDPDLLLFVGALLRGKGIDTLLEAMVMLPRHLRLEIIGSGAQENVFRDLCWRLGLDGRVRFVGAVARDEIEESYRRAACLVVPSRSPETFGFTGPEALLCGTPVVASAVGGTGEWLQDGVTGLSFPSGNADALAHVLRKMIDNPSMAKTMTERGRLLCAERFSADNHIEGLMGFFAEVVRS